MARPCAMQSGIPMAPKPLPAPKSPGCASSRASMARTRAPWPTTYCGSGARIASPFPHGSPVMRSLSRALRSHSREPGSSCPVDRSGSRPPPKARTRLTARARPRPLRGHPRAASSARPSAPARRSHCPSSDGPPERVVPSALAFTRIRWPAFRGHDARGPAPGRRFCRVPPSHVARVSRAHRRVTRVSRRARAGRARGQARMSRFAGSEPRASTAANAPSARQRPTRRRRGASL